MSELDAEKKNGVYLLRVTSVHDGYIVKAGNDRVLVEHVDIHGQYIGVNGYIETECTDFEITDGTLNLTYGTTA